MNDEISSDVRSQRGLALARSAKTSITALVGTKYLVPSATSNGSTYVVDTNPKSERCSCLDWARLGGHDDRPHRCKHLWAVFHVLKLADGNELLVPEKRDEPKKKIKRNWKATNACRTLIPLYTPHYCEMLVDGLGPIGHQPGDNGCPGHSLRDVLLTALIRTSEKLTAGEAVVRVEVYRKAGIIRMASVPSYNTLLRVLAQPKHMALLHRLLAGSALPLIGLEETFVVDGSGWGTSVYDHHFVQKHGEEEQKRKPTKAGWAEAKIVFGVKTLCAPAAQVTAQHVAECPNMPELVRRVVANGGRIKEWLGDAAYNAWYNVVAVEEVGGVPFFDWKEGVTGKTRPAIKRMHDRFMDDQDFYWGRYAYRTLGESGMHAVKERFGYSLCSRKQDAQFAELMLRLICHNIAQLITAVQEFDIDPRYWAQELIAKLPDFGTALPPERVLERLGVLPKETE